MATLSVQVIAELDLRLDYRLLPLTILSCCARQEQAPQTQAQET